MLETRAARLRVLSRMTAPDGGMEETKLARRGTVCELPGGVALEYEDEQDGERARVTLTAGDGRATMRRRGMTSALLEFVPGERRASRYATPYGDIPVAADTRRVSLVKEENGGEIQLEYDVYVAGERTASAALRVTWRC